MQYLLGVASLALRSHAFQLRMTGYWIEQPSLLAATWLILAVQDPG